MVVLKTSRELKAMREAGRISANALKLAGEAVEPGITTWEIDEIVRKYIEGQGAVPLVSRLRRVSGQRVYFCQQCGHPRHTEQEVRCEKRRYCQHRHRRPL